MNRKKNTIPSSLLLMILVIFIVMLLFISYVTGFSGGPLKTVSNTVFLPMQKGFEFIGSSISGMADKSKSMSELRSENESLKKQVETLTTQLNNVQLEQADLSDLENLYQLDKQYKDYPKTGASVIARSSSNWFSSFTIDKGKKDGIKKDMNVIAGSGLCGIVTDVGSDYAVVRAIIDDTSNVSGMTTSTSDTCIVSGSLQDMTEENRITFSGLEDTEDRVREGEPIVTSNISSKFMPGILIGYVSHIKLDANKLTKSGTLTPAVDFKHLQHVLVILETKETGLK